MNSDLPSFLTQTGPASYTLTLSASAADTLLLCAAKYSWSRVTGIEAAAPRAGMNYGKALHLALAHKYLARHGDTARMLGDAEAQMRDWFERNPQPQVGGRGRPEWRTLARAQAHFAAYNAQYPAEDFEVLGVEEPFEVELGMFGTEVTFGDRRPISVTVRFRGIRDLRVRWHDQLWVLDHKTSTEWSDLTVDEGRASFQFMGYAWVEKALWQRQFEATECLGADEAGSHPLPVGGVIGNYLISREPYANADRKPTPRDLPRDQFHREPYVYSNAQLDEWHADAMEVAREIWERWSTDNWKRNRTACAHWGRCEYYRLCWETEPAFRGAAAQGADYRPRTPSPFEDESNGKSRE